MVKLVQKNWTDDFAPDLCRPSLYLDMVVRGKGVGYKKARLVFFWSGNRECSPWAFDEKHLLDGMDLMIHSRRESPFEPRITIFRDTRLKN